MLFIFDYNTKIIIFELVYGKIKYFHNMETDSIIITTLIISVISAISSIVCTYYTIKSKKSADEYIKLDAKVSAPFENIELKITNMTVHSIRISEISLWYKNNMNEPQILHTITFSKKLEEKEDFTLNIDKKDFIDKLQSQNIKQGYNSSLYFIITSSTNSKFQTSVKIDQSILAFQHHNSQFIYADSFTTDKFLGLKSLEIDPFAWANPF